MFICVLAWIGFSIYHNIVTSTISEPLTMQIIPISPNFDTNTINNLKKRNNVSPLYQLGGTVENEVVPTASPTATITPTPGSSQIATSGGGLTP